MFQNDDWQFYPTPMALGRRAWEKFKNPHPNRVLEPSAGDGALIKAHPNWDERYHYRPKVDAIEIDISKHEALRKSGVNVVGIDFMTFSNGAQYSAILLNPPFKYGVQHVLKAWEILWDGEIVAIINSESLKNAFSKERQMLVRLIEQYGEVEFIADAFQGEDVAREADVEIALVYLRKQANIDKDIFSDLLSDLAQDTETGAGLAGQFQQSYDVAFQNSEIENRVAAFNAAVRTMQESVFAEAKAQHYASLLGETMAERIEKKTSKQGVVTGWIQEQIAERYGKLKDAAWAGVLRSSKVTSKLSSKAQKRIESEFEAIKKLEFSCQTVYGFLTGIVESQGQIQIDMACDVFHLITQYHTQGNTVYFKGYKSNDRHRQCGYKIKTTRFVIPRIRSYSDSLDWDAMQMLRDLDKVFSLLEGKAEPELSLETLFNTKFRELKRGERLEGSHFGVRFYPQAGTLHFFPNKKKNLVDRLNRLVGKHRQWLPPREEDVTPNFWQAYDKADKFDSELRETVAKASPRSWGNSPFHDLFSSDKENSAGAASKLVPAIEQVLEANGISPHFQALEQKQPEQLLLAA